MTSPFDTPLASELLTGEELFDLTGSKCRAGQIEWLVAHAWCHVKNKAGEPKVGRLYARCKLAGMDVSGAPGAWSPDLKKVS